MNAEEILRLLTVADAALTAVTETSAKVQALISRARNGQPVTDADIDALHEQSKAALDTFHAAVSNARG